MMYIQDVFTKEECDLLIADLDGKSAPWRTNERKEIKTVPIPESKVWFHERMKKLILRVNKVFEMEITGLTDPPTFVRYDQESFFDWHSDLYTGRAGLFRKFSIVTFLSRPGSYEGGEFQFFDHGIKPVIQPQGSIVVFPAYMQHRVTKVTKGKRFSAVTFVGGETKYR